MIMASMAYLDHAQESAITPGAERRGAVRLTVMIPGRLSLLSGDFDCAIEDISQTGARIVTNAKLRAGAECVLTSLPIDNLCTVVWTDGKAAGLEFIDEISLGAVRLVRWNNDRFRGQHDAALKKMVRGWVDSSE